MKVKPEDLKTVTVRVSSTFHELMEDEYRVKVDKVNLVRTKRSCEECLCGYPFTHVKWEVVAHPDWNVEVEPRQDGKMQILVPGRVQWFRRGWVRGLAESWTEEVLKKDSDGTETLGAFGFDETVLRELCEDWHIAECFRESFREGLLSGLREAWRKAQEALAEA